MSNLAQWISEVDRFYNESLYHVHIRAMKNSLGSGDHCPTLWLYLCFKCEHVTEII